MCHHVKNDPLPRLRTAFGVGSNLTLFNLFCLQAEYLDISDAVPCLCLNLLRSRTSPETLLAMLDDNVVESLSHTQQRSLKKLQMSAAILTQNNAFSHT